MKKNYFKKSLSLVLTVLMLMSCWVFVAPTESAAIDAGDAVTAYNKELLNQIKTDPDTNMVTTIDNRYKRTDNGKAGDTNSNVTSTHLSNSYQNVLNFNNGNIVTSGTGSAVTIIKGTANADSVQVWYPDTVLMYDGGKAKMAVLLEADSNGSSLRTASCYLDGDSDGLYLGFDESNPYWRGHSDDDPAVMYCLWIGASGFQATTNGTKHSSYIFGCKNWSFSATHLYFTGTMSDTEWVRTYNPKWSYRGGTSDDSVHGPVKANGHTIYVMNIQGYKRLVQDIISKKGTLNGKEGQYTRDSLQRFVNACNKITKDLAPKNFVSTTSNNVTSWASQMNTAYTELNNAYNGLVKRNVNVGFENLFSISDWAQSLSPNLQSSSSVEIAVENNDTVKIYKNSAGGEVTTGSSYPNAHVATRYSIPVTGGKDYTVRYDIEASVSGTAQSEVFMFWYDANNNPVNNTAGSATFNNKGFGSTGACSVTFTAPASATKAEIRFDNDCPSSGSTLRFKNIAVYPAERNTAVEVDTWSTRPVMKTVQYGSTLSGKLDVPVRNGYTFNGWYIDNVNVNGVKDSGEEVTDAAGNVTKSVTVTNSINLYADWKPLPMDIGYDNIFSLAEWAKTGSTRASSTNGTIAYDVMAGTITAESTANGEVYNVYGTGADQYVIAVKPNTEYIFEADMDLVTGDKGQMFVFFYNASGSGVTGAIYNGAAQTNAHIGIYPTTEGTSSITFTTPADCTKMAFRVGATNVGTKAVYSNIGFYKKADYDAYAKDYATIRVPFNFGDTTSLALVPTREGYQFDGWYTANGTKLTSVTGLKASDTVYAKWTQLFTVTFKNWDGTVLKTQQVAPGAVATAPQNPNRAADKDYEYDFDKWDTDFSKVNSDLVVTATYKSKDHTGISKTYQSGATCTSAATYTQLCKACGFVWTEVFEDPAMPALGHTYDRENPSGTVVTDKGTETGHTVKCNACDATTTKAHDYKLDANHPASEATCVIVGETYYKCACLREKTEVGTTNPNKHVNTEIINKKDAKCGEEGYTGDTYCNDCKKTVATGTVIEALKHKYTNYVYNEDATCTSDGTKTATCDNRCGTTDTIKAVGTMIPHSFTNYESNGDATCDADGTKTAKCDYKCGKTDTVTDTGSKRAHKFDGAVKNNEDGTHSFECSYDDCAVYGGTVACGYGAWTKDNAATHSHTCEKCNYTPAAEAHTWSAWTTVGGSATEKATQTRSCTVCGRVESTDCNYTVKDYKAATCEAPEITTYECSDCKHGYSVIGEGAKGHNFTKESGVKNNGNGTHSFACANGCGEYGFGTTKNMSVPCSDWTYANTEAGKHTATCKDCAYVKTENCSGGEASCTVKAVCQFCNTAYGEKAPHQFDGKEYFDGAVKAKDATCTEQAEYYVYCSACKKEYTTTETFKYGDLLAHDYTGKTEYLYKATDAKCGVNETYYVYCSACKKSSEGTDKVATFEKEGTALTHKFDGTTVCNNDGTHTITCSQVDCTVTETYNCADTAKLVGANAATCTEAGYYEYICLLCDYEWTVTDTEAPALGHEYTEKNYNNELYVKVAANCDHGTIYWYGCAYCDKNAKDETDTEKYSVLFFENTNDKRAHSWKNVADKAYEATPATCTAAAKYYPSCSYEDCNAIDTSKTFSSGTALGHDFTEKIQDEAHLISAADCVNGSKYYYDCSRCNENAKNDKDSSKYIYTLEDYSGHSMTYKAAEKATCYADGNYEYWYCDTCKKYYKDDEGKDAYLGQTETVIKKREHDLATFSFKGATCEEDGHPAYVDCKYEDCAYTTLPAELPNGYKATGHNFTGAYKYDTVNLYHSKLCANGCDVSGMVVDGKQVKYEVTFNGEDEAVIVGGTKCEFSYTESTKDGIHKHANTCVCGNNTTKTYSDEETFVETVAPTCTAKGYDSYACKDCGATWTKNEVKANGHTAADKPTSNGDGTHSVYCTVENCGYKISTAKCSGGQATCKDKAVCEVCGGAYGETGSHVYAEGSKWVYQNDAKCGVNGTEKNTCTACGTEVSREVVGTALEHDMSGKAYEAKEVPEALKAKLAAAGIVITKATCGADGLSLTYCVNCFDEYTTSVEPQNSDSHDWKYAIDDPTTWETIGGDCSSGVRVVNYCINCGAHKNATIEGTHEWRVIKQIPGDCEEYDYIVFKCAVCKHEVEFNDKYEYYTTDAEGKATKHGYLIDGSFFGVTDENGNLVDYVAKYGLQKRDHNWTEYKVTEEPTCATKGRKIRTCIVCGAEDKVEIDTLANTDGAHDRRNYGIKGYENLIKIKEKDATCTINGNKEYYECATCGFSENAHDEFTIFAYGHNDTNGDGYCDTEYMLKGKKVVCGTKLEKEDTDSDCGCICHKTSGFSKFIYKILRFFWKLFKINKTCPCNVVHY